MRSLGQALVAAGFIYDGIDAARHPAPHVVAAQGPARFLAKVLHQPEPSSGTMTQLIRAHGALVAVAGFSLAVGKAPRTSGAVLALLTAPLVAASVPIPRLKPHTPSVSKPVKQAATREFLRKSALLGAALLAATTPKSPAKPAEQHAAKSINTKPKK